MRFKLKTKEELDKIKSYNEVIEYRRDVIRKDYDKYRRYIEEVEYYADLRFPEVYIARIADYRHKLKNKIGTELDLSAYSLILSLDNTDEGVYNFYMKLHKNKLGEMQYILGLVTPTTDKEEEKLFTIINKK